MTKRIQTRNFGSITDAEIETIKAAVKAKVEGAIGSNQSIWNAFTNQDDNLGFVYKTFTDSEIQFQYFDFPEIKSGGSSNRFVLSGGLSLGPVPSTPVDLCATQRAAVKAKNEEINSLHTRLLLLQDQLHHATPQQKAAIVAEINETNAFITQAEAQLPMLQAKLDSCLSHDHRHDHPGGVVIDPTIVVDPR